ncbi:uncharacterized protein FTOL_08465 [Fusarium torulosum]|uniref:Uncharacterized protein n=1 Tax=Fusarium torulosum TaxID=33205 RepID=A0AAE8MDN4_9HYPO|nr:uncharacterized protein FTOL_08465 [Fusarium torulosum]
MWWNVQRHKLPRMEDHKVHEKARSVNANGGKEDLGRGLVPTVSSWVNLRT